jgi:hypothetical protein
MNGRDLHSAPKTEVVGSAQARGIDLRLVRLQWGKTDIAFSLHAAPNTWSTAGIQISDFLSYLNFQRSQCHFVSAHECYVRSSHEEFDVNAFGQAFVNGYDGLKGAGQHLEACGFFLPQEEGGGYFQGRPSGPHTHGFSASGGDGHTAPGQKRLKTSEDATFSFILSWLEGGPKGWTFHYRPTHPPLSTELVAALEFLKLHPFQSCPEFDFEPCHWRFATFENRADSPFDSNAHYVHGTYDAHAQRFSPGIDHLLRAQAVVEPFGFRFLPLSASPAERSIAEIERRILSPRVQPQPARKGHRFDVAISFAGPERPFAERLAEKIRDAGFTVFYDAFYPEDLWGKDLPVFFGEIYRKAARYCVIFVSSEYVERQWTNHERQHAQARALEERGREYILPIKVDDSDLSGMPPTIGYVSLQETDIDGIAEILLKKLRT